MITDSVSVVIELAFSVISVVNWSFGSISASKAGCGVTSVFKLNVDHDGHNYTIHNI